MSLPAPDGPGAALRDADGMRFALRSRGAIVTAVRLTPMRTPDFARIAAAAADATVAAHPGCRPAWIRGDPALLQLGLDCGAGAPPQPADNPALVCDLVDARVDGDRLTGEIACYANRFSKNRLDPPSG